MSSASKRKSEGDAVAVAVAAKKPKMNYTDTLTVLVGPDEKPFTVHQEVICAKSNFFQAACKKGLKEAEEKLVRLPDMLPHSFNVYSHWAYSGKLVFEEIPFPPPEELQSCTWKEEDTTDAEHTSGLICSHTRFICAYVIGDVLQDNELTNTAISEGIKSQEVNCRIPCPEAMGYLWSNTPVSSVMRKWALDYFPTNCHSDHFYETAEQYPHEFVLEMAKKLVEYLRDDNGADVEIEDACKYHDHIDGAGDCPYAKKAAEDSGEDGSDEE